MMLRLLGLVVVAGACTWLSIGVAARGADTPPGARQTTGRNADIAARPCPVPPHFRDAFEQASRETELPLPLLVAVARVESNLRVRARSEAGARGLLQVMPATARELGLDVDHPPSNVLAGARYLRLMFDRFDSMELALAAYNAGPTAVAKAGGAPGAETLTYVANVTNLWRRLDGCT